MAGPQKLAQVNARLDGKKTEVKDQVTALYKTVQKPALFLGHTRVYTPYKVTGDGREESLPPENHMVQERAREVLARARTAWNALIDGTYTQDSANTRAKADIVVDNEVLAHNVPVTTLMFLKKQWTDIHTFLKNLPTPDPSIVWVYDENAGVLRAEVPQIVQRTKKELKVLHKFNPTDKHPGQADTYTEEVPVGDYNKTDFSGGIPTDIKNAMVARTSKVVEAIKVAHEEANIVTEAPDMKLNDNLFDYVFKPLEARVPAAQAT